MASKRQQCNGALQMRMACVFASLSSSAMFRKWNTFLFFGSSWRLFCSYGYLAEVQRLSGWRLGGKGARTVPLLRGGASPTKNIGKRFSPSLTSMKKPSYYQRQVTLYGIDA